MSIFRIKKENNYTCMSNHHLRNDNISLKSIGLLSVILSMPDNYKVTIKGLAHKVKDGISSVRNSINELIDAGYIVRRQVRGSDGKFCEYEYDIYENPISAQEETDVREALSLLNVPVDYVDDSIDYDNSDNSDDIALGDDIAFDDTEPNDEENFGTDKVIMQNKRMIESLDRKVEYLSETLETFMEICTKTNDRLIQAITPTSENRTSANCTHINTNNINTKKCIYNNPIYQSYNDDDMIDGYEIYNKYRELIKKNIDYDDFVISKGPDGLKDVNEIVDIMTETVAFNTEPLRINGSLIPAEIVKSRFLKVNYEDIEYVLDSLSNTTTKIYNIRKYLIAAIYNAKSTQSHYYGAAVRHDIYGGDRYV